jgi:hypothetical protein
MKIVRTVPRSRRKIARLAFLFIFVFSVASGVRALDYSRYLKLLDRAGDFRVRVNAALVLGRSGDISLASHLESSLLEDSHPAVRAAAAAALAALGSCGSLPALQRAREDRSPAVRAQAARSLDILSKGREMRASSPAECKAAHLSLRGVDHLVTLGDMSDRSGAGDGRIVGLLRSELAWFLRDMGNVAVLADPRSIDAAAKKEMRERNISRLRIDGTVVRVERNFHKGEISSTCSVSLMVLEDPGMLIRAVLNGSATSTGIASGKGERERRALVDQALRSAVRSALSNFDSVIAGSGSGRKRMGAGKGGKAGLRSSVALAGRRER